MIPILAASVISLAVIVERLCFWRSIRSQAIANTILPLVEEGDIEAARRVTSRSPQPMARVLLAGLEPKDLSPGTAM